MSTDASPLFQSASQPAEGSGSHAPASQPPSHGAQNSRLPPGTITGVVKTWIEKKKFGFIARDDGGEDVFVGDVTLEANGLREIEVGDRLVFEVEESRKGDGRIYIRRIFALARGQKYLGIMEAKRRRGGEAAPPSNDVPVDLPVQSNPASSGGSQGAQGGVGVGGSQPAPSQSGPPADVRRLHPDAAPFQGIVEEYDGSRGHGAIRARIAMNGTQRQALVHFKHDLLSPSRFVLPKKGDPIRGLCAVAAHGTYAAVWLDDKHAGKGPAGGARR